MPLFSDKIEVDLLGLIFISYGLIKGFKYQK
jgi:hypothetical protein